VWIANRDLQAESGKRDALAKELQALIQKRDSSAESTTAAGVERALAQKLYWAEAFKELTNVAPRTVWLTAFDTAVDAEGKKVVIAGTSASQSDIAEFYARLERSYFFRDVQIKFTEAEGEHSSLFRFQFEGKVFEGAGGRRGPT
jgi:Tfp pilus assembly protein PilN